MPTKTAKYSGYASAAREKRAVWEGHLDKTSGGLTKDKLKKTSSGRIASKAASKKAKRESNVDPWFQTARDHTAGDKACHPTSGTEYEVHTKISKAGKEYFHHYKPIGTCKASPKRKAKSPKRKASPKRKCPKGKSCTRSGRVYSPR